MRISYLFDPIYIKHLKTTCFKQNSSSFFPSCTQLISLCNTFSSDSGGKVGFHEYMLRRHTTIFEAFKSDGDFGASSRDAFGNYVFILQGVDWEAVKGLADLLYTGKRISV